MTMNLKPNTAYLTSSVLMITGLTLTGCFSEATLWTPCEKSQQAALAAVNKMSAMYCSNGRDSIAFSVEWLGLDLCSRPDSSVGWYVKFSPRCKEALP